MTSVTLVIETSDGEVQTLTRHDYGAILPAERLQGLLQTILADRPARQRDRLLALTLVMERSLPKLGALRSITFYRDTVSVLPEDHGQAPVDRELMLSVDAYEPGTG